MTQKKWIISARTGYKVRDFSTLLPGPYATMTLAGMGYSPEEIEDMT